MIATTHGQGPFAPAIMSAGRTFVATTVFEDEQQAYVAADNVRRDIARNDRKPWRDWRFDACGCEGCKVELIASELRRTVADGL